MSYDAAHPNADIAHRLERIYALHNVDSDFRLTRSPYNDLLERLGNPHLSLPPTVHIAGTNGKGSTQAFLKSIYQMAGYKVHAYTSPHLLTFNERITIANETISDDALARYLDMMETANEGQAVTFFEYTTALAFKAFADTKADICLLETGLGGRLDCTNIIPTAAATVITPIGYDHMDYLGNTIKDIAGEKAGIIKHGTPCIISSQEFKEVYDIIENKASLLDSHISKVRPHPQRYDLGLVGDHQHDNAATAIEVTQTLHSILPIKNHHVQNGLKNAKWPARMEQITCGSVFASLPDQCGLWFDCGHNAQGAKAVAHQFEHWKQGRKKRAIHVIMGLASDKNANDFVAPFIDLCDTLTCVDLNNARNQQSAHDLQTALNNDMAKTAPTIQAAINQLNIEPHDIIFICGSLYLYKEIW